MDRHVVAQASACFGQSFAGVRSVRADVPLAACGDETVLLGRAFGALAPGARAAVLTHELAHVAQRRNRGPQASGRALEHEACAAAAAALLGQPFACVLSDADPRPRAFGPAGHYWTALYVMLAAGMSLQMALEMAFYAQMPDQVDELDATWAGKNYVKNAVNVFESNDTAVNAMASDLWIQRGLHCLTGGSSEAETGVRTGILSRAALGSFEFGIAIHPYGDTFAHRTVDNEALLYSPVMGHAVEYLHLRDAHCPDHLNERPWLYQRYGQGLYAIVRGKPGIGAARISNSQLSTRLQVISGNAGDGAQIQAIRTAIAGVISPPLDGYDPNTEDCRGWSGFCAAHRDVSPALLGQAQGMARRWAFLT